MTAEPNFPPPPTPRRRTRTAEVPAVAPPPAPVPPWADEYVLVEALAAATASTGELARVGHLAGLLQRHRVDLADRERDLASYKDLARQTAEQHRLSPDFCTSKTEVAAYESAIVAARGRVAAVEGELAKLQPLGDMAQARVDQARTALEVHRQLAHPEEREALATTERVELAAIVAVGQARAALDAAGEDARAAEGAYASDSAGWGFVQEARGHVERAKVRLTHAEAAREAACAAVQTAAKALARARYQAAAADADPTAYRKAIQGTWRPSSDWRRRPPSDGPASNGRRSARRTRSVGPENSRPRPAQRRRCAHCRHCQPRRTPGTLSGGRSTTDARGLQASRGWT